MIIRSDLYSLQDRAKIPVKRRPSTRRARQEAVRKSMTDFSLYKNPDSEIEVDQSNKATVKGHKSVNFIDTSNKIQSQTKQTGNIFEDSLEDDDLFKPASAIKPNLAASKTETLFDSAGSEDEDLKVVEKKVKETKPVQTAQITKTGLFAEKSDSDSDSGLFSATQKSKIIPAAKSSLFDDSDSSEDDLFGVKTSGGSTAISSHQGKFMSQKIVVEY